MCCAHPYLLIGRLVTFVTKKLRQFFYSHVTTAVLVRIAKELLELARHFYCCRCVGSQRACAVFTSDDQRATSERAMSAGSR